jgi:hypothetical protein
LDIYWNIFMMHGPINVKFNLLACLLADGGGESQAARIRALFCPLQRF